MSSTLENNYKQPSQPITYSTPLQCTSLLSFTKKTQVIISDRGNCHFLKAAMTEPVDFALDSYAVVRSYIVWAARFSSRPLPKVGRHVKPSLHKVLFVIRLFPMSITKVQYAYVETDFFVIKCVTLTRYIFSLRHCSDCINKTINHT